MKHSEARRLEAELREAKETVADIEMMITRDNAIEAIACDIIRTGDYVGFVGVDEDDTPLVATLKNNPDLPPYGAAIQWIPTGQRGKVAIHGFYNFVFLLSLKDDEQSR